jgi:Uncharacterized conserved protein
MYIGNAIFAAIAVAAVAVVLYLWMQDMTEFVDEMYIWIIAVAGLGLLLAYLIIGPIVFYNRYRYMINDERIDVRRGILIIRRNMVPIERVHQVEVTRGPINNMLGLANVDVTTAGGIARIEYLELEQAEEIAKYLNSLVNKIVKGMRNDQ